MPTNWFLETEGFMSDKDIPFTREEYDKLPSIEKLEWWEKYLGKEKLNQWIVDLIFENPDEMYNDEIVITELEKFYDVDEMIEAIG